MGVTPRLRVLSYNVRHGQGVASIPSNARLARVVSGLAPTVAGLNEVWRIEGLFDQPRRLAELTGMQAVFHELQPGVLGSIGNLLLTTGVVHSTELLDLGGRREKRGCLIADVEADAMRFHFAVTHLSLHATTRHEQIVGLASSLPSDGPLVLVGDFNCGPAELDPLRERLTLSADTPPTYPAVWPLSALDHIGYSADWVLDDISAYPSLASDHRPLVATLRLGEDGEIGSVERDPGL